MVSGEELECQQQAAQGRKLVATGRVEGGMGEVRGETQPCSLASSWFGAERFAKGASWPLSKKAGGEEMGKGGAIRKMVAQNTSEGREGGGWKRPGPQPGGLKEQDTQSRLEQEGRNGMSLFPD